MKRIIPIIFGLALVAPSSQALAHGGVEPTWMPQ